MGRLSGGSFMSRVIGSVGSDMFYVDREREREREKEREREGEGEEIKLNHINT